MKWFLGFLVSVGLLIWYTWRLVIESSEYSSTLIFIERFHNQCVDYEVIYLKSTSDFRSKSCEEAIKKLKERGILRKNDAGDFFSLVKRTEFIYEGKFIIFNIEFKSGREFHVDPRVKYPYQKRGRNDFYTIYPEGFYIPKQ